MELVIQCPFCRWSRVQRNQTPRKGGTLIANSDNNIIVHDCNYEKHVSVIYFHEKKFDILFESGLNAINDYYYREAVASIASSLERFLEYCIELILIDKINSNLFEKSWKYVCNQSERQIGAFYFIFLQEFKETPKMLSNKLISFRNKVIHKGYFPNLNETENFLYAVFDIISEVLNVIKKEKPKYIENYDYLFHKKMRLRAINEIEKVKSQIKHPKYILVPRPFFREIPTFLKDISKKKLTRVELDNYLMEINSVEYYI